MEFWVLDSWEQSSGHSLCAYFAESYLRIGQEICLVGKFSPATGQFIPEQTARKNSVTSIFMQRSEPMTQSIGSLVGLLIVSIVVNVILFVVATSHVPITFHHQ